jgi:hypothetical protein
VQIGSTPHRRPPADQRCGRSSSAAKKADAVFKIALALRNSATSRRSFLSSADSPLVAPGRTPAEQTSDLADGRPLRIVLIADLGDHPHRPLTQLRRVPPRRTTWHDSNLPKKWILRTCRGGSRTDFGVLAIGDVSGELGWNSPPRRASRVRWFSTTSGWPPKRRSARCDLGGEVAVEGVGRVGQQCDGAVGRAISIC